MPSEPENMLTSSTFRKVLLVIINYRTSQMIQALLNTMQEDDLEIEVIILDNGSTEESFETLRQIDGFNVTIIRSRENIGFTGGVNYVLHYCEKEFPEVAYVFLMNPDALLTPNLISDLAEELKATPTAACISPQIIHVDGKVDYAGGFIDYKKGAVSNSSDCLIQNDRGIFEVDVFAGCAVLLDKKKFMEVGLFNEALFMYFDEADVSMRLKEKGYKVLYSPAQKVLHDTSYSTRDRTHVKTYYFSRNKFLLFGGTMSSRHQFRYIFHELAYFLKRMRWKDAYYHLKGVTDGKWKKSVNKDSSPAF